MTAQTNFAASTSGCGTKRRISHQPAILTATSSLRSTIGAAISEGGAAQEGDGQEVGAAQEGDGQEVGAAQEGDGQEVGKARK